MHLSKDPKSIVDFDIIKHKGKLLILVPSRKKTIVYVKFNYFSTLNKFLIFS